jgi:phosphoglycerate dehydrogenase-like enzyme
MELIKAEPVEVGNPTSHLEGLVENGINKPVQTIKPRVAIIDWSKQPIGDPASIIERAVVGDDAEVRTYLCNDDSDFSGEILESSALIVWHNIPITAAAIRRLKVCRAIIRNGVGFDSVDVAAASECNIAVCNVPDYGTEEVADHAIALALALCRQLFPLDAEAKRLGWLIKVEAKMRRLRDLTFGIVGLGRIGTATALRAKALGFKICFYDPYLPNGADKAVGISRAHTLEELLRRSDVVSLHCPLTPETRHMIGERELAWMKPTAYIVNTARGPIIKKSAVLAALRESRLAGAGLDVVEDEPLRSLEEAATPNLIVTCHAAFCSVEAKQEMRTTSARIARAAVRGEPLENIVNTTPQFQAVKNIR